MGNLQHLPAANKSICAVAILRWLGYPRLKGPPNAIT
uniref:ARC6 n=1 Tax=Arundo donax TaxID=35708 RepID=A0A0A9FMR6_ARUDO